MHHLFCFHVFVSLNVWKLNNWDMMFSDLSIPLTCKQTNCMHSSPLIQKYCRRPVSIKCRKCLLKEWFWFIFILKNLHITKKIHHIRKSEKQSNVHKSSNPAQFWELYTLQFPHCHWTCSFLNTFSSHGIGASSLVPLHGLYFAL